MHDCLRKTKSKQSAKAKPQKHRIKLFNINVTFKQLLL